jgi:hypothetical protein
MRHKSAVVKIGELVFVSAAALCVFAQIAGESHTSSVFPVNLHNALNKK